VSSSSYTIGRWLGQRPAVITAIIAAVVGGVLYLIIPSNDEVIEQAKRIAAEPPAATAPRIPAHCQDRTALLASYQALMESKEHWKAAAALRPCLGSQDPELKELVTQAEVADAKATANNKAMPVLDRQLAIQRLERIAPTEAASLAKLKAQLERKAEADAKAAARALAALKKKQGVSIGMTKEDVLASSWGKPDSVNTSIYSFGTHEQWVYGLGNYLYFKNGVLSSIQTGN
jgi:hypothetical protein